MRLLEQADADKDSKVTLDEYKAANPKATEDEIRKGLNGNVCRCGTYANIVQAAIAVVKGGK